MKMNEMILYKNTEYYGNLAIMERLYEGDMDSS